MALNPSDIDAVRASFQELRRTTEPVAEIFYTKLFDQSPELRSMFRDDLTGQGMKFMTTLGTALEQLGQPETLSSEMGQLGQLHATLGVRQSHFQPMEDALIETMRHALGDSFTLKLEAAWRLAFVELSQTLIDKGHIPD